VAPAAALAPQAAPPARPPVLEFRGIDVSGARPQPAASRRPMQPRWADASAPSAPAARDGSPTVPSPARGAGRPARRARSVLVHAWWLAVPAAAAALGWPLRRGADAAPAAPAAAATTRWPRVTEPPVLATVTARRRAAAARQAAAGALAHRDADASGVADEVPTAPAAPAVDLPTVDVSTPAPARPAHVLVRPEEFTTRIKIPGMPQ
jgi:hypothetical protein